MALRPDYHRSSCPRWFDIKTGTIFYGIITLLIHLTVTGLLILANFYPDYIQCYRRNYDGVKTNVYSNATDGIMSKERLCMAFVMVLAWIASVLALLFGVARNRAVYLIPCFTLQVFDFWLTFFIVGSLFIYASPVKEVIRTWRLDLYPGGDTLSSVEPDLLRIAFVICIILVLSVKGCLIVLVWSCYRLVKGRETARATTTTTTRSCPTNPDVEVIGPPCYEDVFKVQQTMDASLPDTVIIPGPGMYHEPLATNNQPPPPAYEA